MKRILLPTDFSDNSLHAMDYALRFFSGNTATFYILNVQKSSEYITDDLMTSKVGDSLHDTLARENKKKLLHLASEYRKKHAQEHYTFQIIFDFDTLNHAVEEAVVKKDIDLIVMGTNGASGAKEAIFGSNTLQLIRHLDCPILAIPEAYIFEDLKDVLLSVIDNTFPESVHLEPLSEFIQNHKPTLHLLNILSHDAVAHTSKTISNIKLLFPETKIRSYTISDVPVPMAISTFVQLNKIDLHASVIEKRSFLDRFIHGSLTSKLSYGTKVPLLVLRP
jgi:nucleotide-binding universal stress UspA family protein